VSTLLLDSAQRSQIEREARAAFPRECCGLIEGVHAAGPTRVVALHATRNIAVEADRFEIDPADQFRILRAVRASGTDVVGCYHSHPNGRNVPSARDCAGAGEEGLIWLIASLSLSEGARLSAFVWRSDVFVPITIVWENAN
jgi:proteasome lid subunit RPN8/RPN11